MYKIWYILALNVFGLTTLLGQGITLYQDDDLLWQVDRARIQRANPTGLHSSFRPLTYDDIFDMLRPDDSLVISSENYWHIYLLDLTKSSESIDIDKPSEIQNKENKFWNHFYKNKTYFFSKYGQDYFLQFNPIINFSFGQTNQYEGATFANQRGLRLSGGINDIFFFYTDIIETQIRFPEYVNDYITDTEAVPGNGFYKRYASSLFDFENGYDFLNSTGHLAVKVTDNVGFQLGHGKHFIGHGQRSLLLSDFSNNAFYLQADWKFWKIHYRNIWTELRPRSAVFGGGEDDVLPRKYSATHHLSINFLPTLNVGIFETVVFHRSNQFELGYLNPVILYRTVEQSANSPDNVLLGFDFHWDLWRTLSFYGQVIFDEFKLDELILDNQGWWGNKYGFQIGAQYIDVFNVENLDARLEYNSVRPYTYTHRDSSASYSHYNLPLAHPLGANFKEIILNLRYSKKDRWIADLNVISYLKGRDGEGQNWGGDILKPHDQRERDYDNVTGQGNEDVVRLMDVRLSYRLYHGIFADGQFIYRSSGLSSTSENVFKLGLRMNLGYDNLRF